MSTRSYRTVVGFLVIALLALGVIQGCGQYNAELDPRDVAGLEAWECNRRSTYVTLKVVNQSTFSARIHLVHRSGGSRRLQPTVHGFQTERIEVNRSLMTSGGFIVLEITGGGLVTSPPRPISLEPMQCDVGTLFITPSPSMSTYVGADF